MSDLNPTKLEEMGRICQQAAKLGGQILLDYREIFKTREKAPMDLVTDADLASQRAIRELIWDNFPEHQFLGEEADLAHSAPATPDPPIDSEAATRQLDAVSMGPTCWIVDPLDGTVNYVHGLQSYSVSVAVADRGKLLAGAVYDPLLDEMFCATNGQNATLNGLPIRTSNRHQCDQSLVAVSLPARSRRGDPETEQMLRLLEATRSIRRLGSAALNLCYVAAGRLDGYLATSLNVWDVAAGALILQQAGGTIRHADDGEFDLTDPRILAAATRPLWNQLHRIIQVTGPHSA